VNNPPVCRWGGRGTDPWEIWCVWENWDLTPVFDGSYTRTAVKKSCFPRLFLERGELLHGWEKLWVVG
jgi:hypothetical protein